MILTVVSSMEPGVTRCGRLGPKVSSTLSSSSSSVSSVAVKSKVFEVSPVLKVSLIGTTE